MAFYFYVVEPALADLFLLDMDWRDLFPLPLGFKMGESVFRYGDSCELKEPSRTPSATS